MRRFSVSLEDALFEDFNRYLAAHKYRNRSEAVRDLIRLALLEEAGAAGGTTVGVLSLVYDHCRRQIPVRLTDLQHEHHELILSSTHIHLDHERCLEVVILKGKSPQIKALADRLIALCGVDQGSFSVCAAMQKPHNRSRLRRRGHEKHT